jgi:hypothetical protein
MTHLHFLTIQVFSWGIILASGFSSASATERHKNAAETLTRQAEFKLTFANRDLIWLGDPASPTSLVYPKPGARPIATDFQVTTMTENHTSPSRQYLREARIVADGNLRKVYAFTSAREKLIGTIDNQGRFSPNKFYKNNRELLSTWPADASTLAYDSQENSLYYEVEIPGPVVSETLDFLPLALADKEGNAVAGRFSIDYAPSAAPSEKGAAAIEPAAVSLTLQNQGKSITLAKATVPSMFRRADVELGSFDNKTGTYLPEAAYRPGASGHQEANPSVTFAIRGEFTSSVQSDGKSLVVVDAPQPAEPPTDPPTKITIDGNFDDWRNVAGVDDRRGDSVPYLEYIPDVDLLEFKVAHDDQHIYLYARVAGQVGRSHSDGGRGYFYAYMDVDQNPGTGFLPTRDDDCYFGVDIGDDCEVQFEFVNNTFRKTFYGFCGLGGDGNVLKQEVTIGKSQYGRLDDKGVERADYKSEYIYRDGIAEITEDLKLGTSDTIQLAVSSDGSEVEVVSALTGFLKDSKGHPTIKPGQTIDIAAGMECDSKAYLGKTRWAADSTIAIRGYQLRPSDQ